MKMQFVLAPIPEKFSAKGGYNGRFINQKGLDGKAVIEEAIAMDYVPNYTPQQVKACAMGLLESMLAGVARDGNPRSVDGFIKVQPVLRGRFPKEDSSYDPEVNSVVVNVQLLHELKPIDISSWSLVNATPKDDPPTPPPPTPTGDEPELERGYSEGEGHPDGQVFPSYAFILQGVHLDGAAVKIGYVEEGTPREVDVPDEKLTVTDTVIEIASDSVELEDAILSGSATVTFKVTTPNGTATYEAEVQQ